jgi:hypothetical protein
VSVDTAVAKYEERRFDGKRLFELFADRIVVSGGASLGARFEERVSLDTLTAVPDRLWTRPAGFWSGVGMAIVFSLIPLGFESVLSSWWKGLFWVGCASGVLLALATSRRIEWAVFRNTSGVRVLAVARAGPNRDHFEPFIEAVRQAIVNCSQVRNDRGTDT